MNKMQEPNIQELLITAGLLSEEERTRILNFKDKSGLSFIKIALNYGYISRKKLLAFYKEQGYTITSLYDEQFDESLFPQLELAVLEKQLSLPIRWEEGKLLVALADPNNDEAIKQLEAQFKCEVIPLLAPDLDIIWHSHKFLGTQYVKSAVFNLARKDPNASALITFTNPQLLVGLILTCIVVVGLVFSFKSTLITINIILSVFFLLSIVFKLILALNGSRFELFQPVTKQEVKNIVNDKLPVYTIQLPVYKESELIKKLIWNLQSLDYPRHKLDIKLLIEEDDTMTLNAVRDLEFPAVFEVIVVPFHMPKTKPKACNYGLHFSKGKYLTIYDAEDIPDSDQLKKVVALFRKLPSNYICIQSALNYFNRNENLLTRMFTLEYSYWFDYMLPGLSSLDIPIPLGGTSNHFKLSNLLELGGWDPFNVTEDADLGIRAYAKGYKVGIVNSTTYEEANNEPFNWIRQRSRWIKGYMQTYLVHMRNPSKLIKTIGWKGFLGFQFFIGATPIAFLIYPILLALFIAYLIFPFPFIREFFPDWVLFIAIFNLMVGTVLMIYINMMAVFKRRLYELIIFAMFNPIYWIMHSIAAYKGLWQLITKPFYWEKTDHGLTKVSTPINVIE